MLIKGTNPEVDHHELKLGKLYFSASTTGCVGIDASEERWKVFAYFIAGDESHMNLLLADLETYDELAR